jgi:hypothetical protein
MYDKAQTLLGVCLQTMAGFSMTLAGHVGVVEPAGHCFKFEPGGDEVVDSRIGGRMRPE